MLRIGLTQRVDVQERRNERRDCLDQAWSRLLAENEWIPVPLSNTGWDAATMIDHLQLDGVVLTGGNDLAIMPDAQAAAPERDKFETDLLEICGERALPVLGVCRGMQLIAVTYGSRVTRVFGHVAREHAIVVLERDTMPIMGRTAVNSFHCYGIQSADLSPSLRAVAAAPDGTIEAVAHISLLQWGIMWHPERAPHDPANVELLRACFDRRAR